MDPLGLDSSKRRSNRRSSKARRSFRPAEPPRDHSGYRLGSQQLCWWTASLEKIWAKCLGNPPIFMELLNGKITSTEEPRIAAFEYRRIIKKNIQLDKFYLIVATSINWLQLLQLFNYSKLNWLHCCFYSFQQFIPHVLDILYDYSTVYPMPPLPSGKLT